MTSSSLALAASPTRALTSHPLLQRYAAARTTFLATVMAAPPSALAPGAVGGAWARGVVEHYMGHIPMLEGKPAA